MSKVRDLPEITTLANDDLIYAVESAVNPNGGRKATVDTLRTAILEPAAVKAAYESNANTNDYTDAEKAKLAGIEPGATADQTAAQVPYSNTVSGLPGTNVQDAIDEVNNKAQADFRPSIVSNRILNYSGGTARFDGVFFSILTNNILLNANITNGYVYVDLDGLVKQTGSGILPPPFTIVFAKFSTDLNNIISLEDQRVKNSQNLVRGLVSDIDSIEAGDTAYEGDSGRVSDAAHRHAVSTGAPSTQHPDQANAEGSSTNLARADHIHDIPTDVPVTLNPDQANAEGTGTSFARNDHVHNIPAAAPSSTFAPSTANAKGSSASFALADHTHTHAIGLDADVTAIQPDDTASTGAVDKFAKAGHRHAIATAAPATQNADQANAKGTSTSFARADHVHNIPTAAATSISTSTANAQGASTSFARADHTHAVSVTNQEVTATADDTATSLTDILMNSMTVTPAAGTYLVMWSGSIVNSANGAERSWISLYLAGAQVSATERSIGTAGGAYVPSMTQAVIAVNGSQAIELRWRVAGGTSTVHSRRLTLLKLA